MTIDLYSVNCEGCNGNHSLNKIKQVCKKLDVKFQEKRTIFWERWEQEAKEIQEVNPGLSLPFFYCEETGAVFVGDSLTPLEEIEAWVKTQGLAGELPVHQTH